MSRPRAGDAYRRDRSSTTMPCPQLHARRRLPVEHAGQVALYQAAQLERDLPAVPAQALDVGAQHAGVPFLWGKESFGHQGQCRDRQPFFHVERATSAAALSSGWRGRPRELPRRAPSSSERRW